MFKKYVQARPLETFEKTWGPTGDMYDWWRPFDLFNLINFFLTLFGKIKAIKLLHGLYYKQKWILHKCNHCLFDTYFTVTGLQPEKTPAVTVWPEARQW